MKRFVVFALAVLMMLGCMVACGETVKAMTYAEYAAAEMDSEVIVEAYVQATQGTWEEDGKQVTTLYLQDENGGYFAYKAAISKTEFDKIAEGTKVRVTGVKGEWEGEVEIMEGTVEVLEGTWVATAKDLTAELGKDTLIDYQNQKAAFKGLTVVSVAYQNEDSGDIYLTVSKDGAEYSFCVESYLTGEDTDVYKAVGALAAGDTVDVEGFLYWYKGVNTHITAVTKK